MGQGHTRTAGQFHSIYSHKQYTRCYDKDRVEVFKTRHFCRWIRKTEITDTALCKAVHEMSQGLIDADLGGGLVKKRVAGTSRGKSSGFRTIVATNKARRWFFVFGFAKNVSTNIDRSEKEALRWLAQDLLNRTDTELARLTASGALQEILCLPDR